jgi:hypothetical protein
VREERERLINPEATKMLDTFSLLEVSSPLLRFSFSASSAFRAGHFACTSARWACRMINDRNIR